MGFRVGIDGNADFLLRQLKSSPAQVFDRPYKGYLLFLAGVADQETCEWLAENALALDSLTGEDLAFAIFARKFHIKLHTSRSNLARPPRYVGEISSDEIALGSIDVQRLVKSGRCGWVMDGDEVAAVTYAVDEIAKGFGILGELPCVVVLDAIPYERINFVRLSEQVRKCFVELLRRSLANFSAMPGYSQLEISVQQILDLHREIDKAKAVRPALEGELRSARESLKHLEFVGPESDTIRGDIELRVKEAQVALYHPSLRRFREALTGSRQGLRARKQNPIPGLDHQAITEVIEHAELHHQKLFLLRRTIYSLATARMAAEPERSQRLTRILGKYLAQLLPDRSIPPVEDVQNHDIDQILHDLQHERDSLVSIIMSRIPSKEVLISNLQRAKHDHYLHELEQRRKRIREIEKRMEALSKNSDTAVREATQSYIEAVRNHFAGKPASLWEAISHTLREMKLDAFSANVKTTAANIAAGVFRPDILIKIWDTFTK
jgi:hypothetical protein